MTIHHKVAILILLLSLDRQGYMVLRGHESVSHSRPYMVLLERHTRNGQKDYCGGFLLSEDFVMTTAYCQATSYKVFLGLHDYHKQKGVQHVTVKKSFLHDDYKDDTYENDIMLLKEAEFRETVRPIVLAFPCDDSLPQSCVISGWGRTKAVNHMSAKLFELSDAVKFNENVKPIVLADDESVPKSCVVPGWGKTEKGELSNVLLEVNVTLTDNELCAKANKYCSEGETRPSAGDGGGPLVCEDGKAYGVVSAILSQPGGVISRYTKIPHYRDWIGCTIGKALFSLTKTLTDTSDIMEHYICVKAAG